MTLTRPYANSVKWQRNVCAITPLKRPWKGAWWVIMGRCGGGCVAGAAAGGGWQRGGPEVVSAARHGQVSLRSRHEHDSHIPPPSPGLGEIKKSSWFFRVLPASFTFRMLFWTLKTSCYWELVILLLLRNQLFVLLSTKCGIEVVVVVRLTLWTSEERQV